MDAQGRQPKADESLLAVLREIRARRLTRLIADEPSATGAFWERLAQAAVQADRPWIREWALVCARREARSSGAGLASGPDANPLSSREIQIVRLVAAGQSNKQVARSLFLTENTVESHLRRINTKLGTRNRTQAIARARDIAELVVGLTALGALGGLDRAISSSHKDLWRWGSVVVPLTAVAYANLKEKPFFNQNMTAS